MSLRARALLTALAGSVALAAVAVVVPAGAGAATPREQLDALVAQRSVSSTSVSVYDVTARRTLTVGSTSGMVTASVVKLELLETLLAVRQAAHRQPTATDRRHLVPMIERSSNADATWVYGELGGRAGVRRWEHHLGLALSRTVLGPGGYWGLTTTNAAQQIVLLKNLVAANSPLSATRRAYALYLMRHVEQDQRWGVPVVATSGTAANKNGWVNVVRDHNYWAINSVGVVTVNGHELLVAVLTQHNHGSAAGVQRVEQLARAAVAAELAG